MFLGGVSTRTLAVMSSRLIGRKISHTEISQANKELVDSVERWRNRDLSKEQIKYLFVDGVNFDMRIGDSIEKTPVLVAIGVTESGQRLVVGLQAGDKESASSWREFFKDLKRRGLDSAKVTMGIMDGLPGSGEGLSARSSPEPRCSAARSMSPAMFWPRCHRNSKRRVADGMRSIFYASSREKAREFFAEFKAKWEIQLPSAVRCLEKSLDACLTFFNFPEDEWISLRTTNIIERLNKEFKRRTKPMEIVAGERSCYTLLAFIALKMELHWRSNPIGKVRKNLPLWKILER